VTIVTKIICRNSAPKVTVFVINVKKISVPKDLIYVEIVGVNGDKNVSYVDRHRDLITNIIARNVSTIISKMGVVLDCGLMTKWEEDNVGL